MIGSIFKNIKLLSLSAILLLCFSACQDDLLRIDDEVPRQDNLPVEFQISINKAKTRGPNFFKTDFDPDDVVHINAVFILTDGSKIEKYAALIYRDDKWQQYTGSTDSGEVSKFTWPNNAVSAEFVAYYMPDSNSLMVPGDAEAATPVSLGSLFGTSAENSDKDPLRAETLNVKYGHTIGLEFYHACAYLTIEELPAGIANDFWFTQETASKDAPESFKNAYRLYLDRNNKLVFEFVQVPDPDYENKVYIQGTTSRPEMIDGNAKVSASFFLAPESYMNFVIGYPGSSSMVNYLSYTKASTPINPNPGPDPVPDPDPSAPDDDDDNLSGDIEGGTPDEPLNPYNELRANGVYTFNVSKSKGVVIENPLKPDTWDEGEDPIVNVDAEKFLWAICNNEEYVVGEYKVIQPEGNVSKLMHNVNMQWQKYDVFAPSETNGYKWFEPSLGQGKTFDGGLHYIFNLGSPLFMTVDGSVRNLGLSNANISFVTMESYTPQISNPEPDNPETPYPSDGVGSVPDPGSYQLSRCGAICGYLNNGSIENIRIKTMQPTWDDNNSYRTIFNVNAFVYGISSQESHSIGTLIGSNNNGLVNNITITCNMNLNVSNYTGENNDVESRIPRVYIGGIIGQNVDEMHNVSTSSDSQRITIVNSCTGDNASYSIGGAAGIFSEGKINNFFLPNIFIDSRNSVGVTSYIGGLAGRMSSVDQGGQLVDCQVGGSIYAGKCIPNEDGINGSAYTGGFAGETYESYLINNNYSAVNVYGPNGDNYLSEGVDYATGGMFGKISYLPGDLPSKFIDNMAMGSELRGPNYIGNFAGVVPKNQTWEADFEPNGNMINQLPNQSTGGLLPDIGHNDSY